MTYDSVYPKVLIFGQPFNNFSGGGITLTNLFNGWPNERIAVVANSFIMNNISTDICRNYYQIGREEYHWRFPFNLYKETFPSGRISDANFVIKSSIQNKPTIRGKIAKNIINPIINWLGLSHYISYISLSSNLQGWISDFGPDILYIQVSNREGILFAQSLIAYLKIPSAIHMMDDWPSIISTKGLFRKFWKKKINNELRRLLNSVDLHLSICDAMSEEYKLRYGIDFTSFHNIVNLETWLPYRKTSFKSDKNEYIILFSGRIGRGIENSLFDVATAIESLNRRGQNVKLNIQSPNIKQEIVDRLKIYKCVHINPQAEYSLIPKLYSNADILVIANDFNKEGIKFLKFSMPTKAPEYMISGTPVLVYASSETAVSKFFAKNECGHCVTNQSIEELANSIDYLLRNTDYQKQLSENAVKYAQDTFSSTKVRGEFRQLLYNLSGLEAKLDDKKKLQKSS